MYLEDCSSEGTATRPKKALENLRNQTRKEKLILQMGENQIPNFMHSSWNPHFLNLHQAMKTTLPLLLVCTNAAAAFESTESTTRHGRSLFFSWGNNKKETTVNTDDSFDDEEIGEAKSGSWLGGGGGSNKSTQQSEPGKGSRWSIDKLTSGLNGLQKKFDVKKKQFNEAKTQAVALKKQTTGFFGTQSDQATPHGNNNFDNNSFDDNNFDNGGYRRLSLRGSTHN